MAFVMVCFLAILITDTMANFFLRICILYLMLCLILSVSYYCTSEVVHKSTDYFKSIKKYMQDLSSGSMTHVEQLITNNDSRCRGPCVCMFVCAHQYERGEDREKGEKEEREREGYR